MSHPLLNAVEAHVAAAPRISKADLQSSSVAVLALASTFAKFTKTTRDDEAVALMLSIVLDPAKFDQLCKIAGIGDTPAV
jgi:hypothetical protein